MTFTVVVTNLSMEPLTLTSLVDDVHGPLSALGTCTNAINSVLQPSGQQGDTYTCEFSVEVAGCQGIETDTVTARVTNPANETLQAATVAITGESYVDEDEGSGTPDCTVLPDGDEPL